MVKSSSRWALVSESEKAGFIEVAETDVGASPTIAFVVAPPPRAPGATSALPQD
ncbi:MAG: hypothetical protein IV100_11470 [Myxococcales bacterium]|nr:hypothetical protein [Myxococcales bacterium]